MSPKELQELKEWISTQSDKYLLKIVNVDSKDYRKEAVEFARGELEKRGLSSNLKAAPATTLTLSPDESEKQVALNSETKTTVCKFCGFALSSTAAECPGCGYGTSYGLWLEEEKELEKIAAKNAITLINCPACNSEVSNQAAACPKCGHPIKDPEPVKVSTSRPFVPLKKKNVPTSRMPVIGWIIIGFLVGAFIGFQLRPSVPLVGQLPFDVVISQGSNLRGLDRMLVSSAQASFNIMIVGGVLGAIVGAIIGGFRAKK
ncbi:MAG TPA: zinc ribbon domain-containing protein [Pyrinomonadaceae bacterium]